MYEKLTKFPNFTWFLPEKFSKSPNFYYIFTRKINKIPEFYTIVAEKNARILHNNCVKSIFPNFLGGKGGVPPPLSPVSYAYDDHACLLVVGSFVRWFVSGFVTLVVISRILQVRFSWNLAQIFSTRKVRYSDVWQAEVKSSKNVLQIIEAGPWFKIAEDTLNRGRATTVRIFSVYTVRSYIFGVHSNKATNSHDQNTSHRR